jgi:4-methyl-5(b-hydroxyethyl)-thiazole monophosphate biosynthesis
MKNEDGRAEQKKDGQKNVIFIGMKTALVLLADGFEELEFVAPTDILRRGGVNLTTASIRDSEMVRGAHNISVMADMRLKDNQLAFDLVVLPGGGKGTENLGESEMVLDLVRRQNREGRLLAAICAAPTVLAKAGVLQGHKATSYPSVKDEVAAGCAEYLEDRVVRSGNIFTSRGAGTAVEFGYALLAALEGQEKADEIKAQIVG